MSYMAGVLTASDKGSRGEREDESGRVIREILSELGIEVREYRVVPDERDVIADVLREWSERLDLIVTTGGTGLGPRDVTPDATREVIDREIPGMADEMRRVSIAKTPHGMLSRALCGARGKTLIINLPGSPRAVRECLDAVKAALPHALEVLQGRAAECARLRG